MLHKYKKTILTKCSLQGIIDTTPSHKQCNPTQKFLKSKLSLKKIHSTNTSQFTVQFPMGLISMQSHSYRNQWLRWLLQVTSSFFCVNSGHVICQEWLAFISTLPKGGRHSITFLLFQHLYTCTLVGLDYKNCKTPMVRQSLQV